MRAVQEASDGLTGNGGLDLDPARFRRVADLLDLRTLRQRGDDIHLAGIGFGPEVEVKRGHHECCHLSLRESFVTVGA